MKKCGYIAILGETNAGKSTLINKLVGQKVSIVSRKIQTTLSRILGIAIYQESQIIFIDTPGFPYNASKVSESLSKITWDASRETDYIIFVIDVSKKKLDTSINILKKISTEKKVVLVMNKIDLIHKPELLKIADFFSKIREFEKIFMISSITGSGTDDFLKYCANIIPDGEWIYPEDEITDSSFEKYTSEITREHIYHRLHHEIPYKCTVETENYQQQSDGSIKIVQNIYVKNNAHKIIFLGHNGEKIKAIGKATRKELSNLLNRNVHLFLNVVVKEK